MHVQIKDGRVELARKRQKFDLDAYGERRDSEQPKAANLSAWRIAENKAMHIVPEGDAQEACIILRCKGLLAIWES